MTIGWSAPSVTPLPGPPLLDALKIPRLGATGSMQAVAGDDMTAYVIKRLSLTIPTLVVVNVMVFSSVGFIPGDVIDTMIAQMGSSGSMSRINREYFERAMGLDVPVHAQYARWLGVGPQEDGSFRGLLQGDLGKSLWRNQSVTDLLIQRLPVYLWNWR
jgi:peptide/nickel transport system permease protein